MRNLYWLIRSSQGSSRLANVVISSTYWDIPLHRDCRVIVWSLDLKQDGIDSDHKWVLEGTETHMCHCCQSSYRPVCVCVCVCVPIHIYGAQVYLPMHRHVCCMCTCVHVLCLMGRSFINTKHVHVLSHIPTSKWTISEIQLLTAKIHIHRHTPNVPNTPHISLEVRLPWLMTHILIHIMLCNFVVL